MRSKHESDQGDGVDVLRTELVRTSDATCSAMAENDATVMKMVFIGMEMPYITMNSNTMAMEVEVEASGRSTMIF